MIKLIGYVDGVQIGFTFCPPNTFTAEIPKKLDGTYIVQLSAVDDAGNITNYSNIFIEIDFQKLNFRIIPDPYSTKNESNYSYFEIDSKYKADCLPDSYIHKGFKNYAYKELM